MIITYNGNIHIMFQKVNDTESHKLIVDLFVQNQIQNNQVENNIYLHIVILTH